MAQFDLVEESDGINDQHTQIKKSNKLNCSPLGLISDFQCFENKEKIS
jgi:hypothetical protein